MSRPRLECDVSDAEVVDLDPDLDRCSAATSPNTVTQVVRERVPSPDEAAQLAGLFRLLGDPSRARLLYALLEAGELCVGDIAEVIDASETSVSQALRLLRTAGVVRARRDGRHVRYRLDDAHVRLLLDLSREHLRHAEPTARGTDRHG